MRTGVTLPAAAARISIREEDNLEMVVTALVTRITIIAGMDLLPDTWTIEIGIGIVHPMKYEVVTAAAEGEEEGDLAILVVGGLTTLVVEEDVVGDEVVEDISTTEVEETGADRTSAGEGELGTDEILSEGWMTDLLTDHASCHEEMDMLTTEVEEAGGR